MVKLSPVEALKQDSRYLRGPLADDLLNDSPFFSKPSQGLLKFHGAYQQDDRDIRKGSAEKSYSCMVRVSIPGGAVTAAQYLALDTLAAQGDGTLRITSRQGIQYHVVLKRNIKFLISQIVDSGLNTWAACGDVVRNVVAPAEPFPDERQALLRPYVLLLARELKPHSEAYAEIWLDGEKAITFHAPENAQSPVDTGDAAEPLYGATFLPRKFKIGFAFEGDNSTDLYSHDLGFVPHFRDGAIEGFTLLAGGGLGQSNGVKASHARLADEIGYIPAAELLNAAKAVVSIHRDFGNRENRKLARLKYVLAARGVEWFRTELGTRLGHPIAPPRPLAWSRQSDYLGWHEGTDGTWFFGLRVISGRIQNNVRLAIREIVETLAPAEVRFTAQQNLLFTHLPSTAKGPLEAILARHGVALAHELPPILRQSMACPALPTCGQALAESERVLPDMVAGIQAEFDRLSLATQDVVLRMTGCPNGCARPYTAEIGIVGQSPGLYSIYLGGSPNGTRLAGLLSHNIKQADLASALRPLLESYAAERQAGEAFGDYWARTRPASTEAAQ